MRGRYGRVARVACVALGLAGVHAASWAAGDGVGATRSAQLGPPRRVVLSAPSPGAARPAAVETPRRRNREAPEDGGPGPTRRLRALADPIAEGDSLTVIRRTNLRAFVPQPFASLVSEPCAAKSGDAVVAVGNFFGAVSVDGGERFAFIDPATAFPPVAGGFCCDQSVIYEPTRDLFVWVLLYADDGRANVVRLAVAKGAAAVAAGTWDLYDIAPRDVRLPERRFLDYPQVAVASQHLYLTANAFRVGPFDRFTEAVALRIPLDDLAAGGALHVDAYATDDGHFTFTPVQGASDTMYWAAHDPKRFLLRVYRWPEASDTIGFTDVPVSPWERREDAACPGPDGRDWCGHTDGRIQTGWIGRDVAAFMWNAPQAEGRPLPFVRVARIDTRTRALVDEPDVFSPDVALQYPAVGLNSRGDLAGVVAVGGGARPLGVAAFTLPAGDAPPAWRLQQIDAGDSGPARNRWGDYLCVRPDFPGGETWIATGHVMRGGPEDAYTQPLVYRLGRPGDLDCSRPDRCADDGNPCTADRCEAGVCAHAPRTAVPCETGDFCTVDDVCAAGTCAAGPIATCADDDACTIGECEPTTGCLQVVPPTIDGVRCRFDQGLEALAPCGSDAIPARVARPFEAAARLVTAESRAIARRARRARALVERAARRLSRPEVRSALSPGCQARLRDRLEEIADLLGALSGR